MTSTILRPLSAPPPKDWSCIVCHEQDDAFDLITHKGCDEQCIFHRDCYPDSDSSINGECQKCGTFLHKDQVSYVTSEADSYQIRGLALVRRVAERAKKQDRVFSKKEFETIIRSDSWCGSHSRPYFKDMKEVCTYVDDLESNIDDLESNIDDLESEDN